ncbi:hypothetical protein Kisp01_19940 [Kineosporia sp. NBRC 101677]|uniref:hypothetical protein n=1 Tax=Kineosporia sp. NBRC 101677 TaxID=3032197 RepID=UPI0024A48961|nr:hypothetical protein [Kineosporia sp. NBRC 101677]GLY14979.1 hypothetical protein Kisp01_19940 [Kineosporia sp. NBRC 101677]
MGHDELDPSGRMVPGLRRLAAGATAGSRPFPALEKAIRRGQARYSYYSGMALAVASALVMLGLVVLTGSGPGSVESPRAPVTPAQER